MSRTQPELEQMLDQALDEVRDDALGEVRERAIADRSWGRIERELARTASRPAGGELPEEIRGCPDYQALIPTYLAGGLSPARRLLLEDHSRECIACRRALLRAREGRPEPAPAARGRGAWAKAGPFLRRAAMVLVAVGVGFGAWQLLQVMPLSWGQTARVDALDGHLYRVVEEGYVLLAAGQEVPYGATLRTSKGSSAVVTLEDGSQVEMSERAQVEMVRRLTGTTIELGRGSIIVEAAEQGSGRLHVATADCTVTVKGTIFSVNNGTKGSRVSVIEGEVEVGYGARHAVLEPGEQLSTHPSVGPVPVADEIAWSRNVDQYLALMSELNALRKELHETMSSSGLRYSTGLLDLVPEGTTFFVSIPNVSSNVREAHALIQERVQASPVLTRWWRETFAGGHEAHLAQAVEKMASFGEYLGDEVVLALGLDQDGAGAAPQDVVVMAATSDSAGLRALIEAELAELGDAPSLVLVDDPAAPAPAGGDETLYLWVGNGLVAATSSPQRLAGLAAVAEQGQANPFVASGFHDSLAEAYRDGADWLIGADLHSLVERVSETEDGAVLEKAGVQDVRYLVLERKQGTGEAPVHYRAVLSFDGPRRGLASWISEPAPMASLDFISPDANLVAAFLLKDPAQAARELLAILDLSEEEIQGYLDQFQNEQGIRLIDDFAATLGGEVAFAIDGPLLPTPSWKAIFEVYDAPRLQNTLQWLADRLGVIVQIDGERLFRLDAETSGGRTYYRLGTAKWDVDVYYTYLDGYLLAGPSRALLERAIRTRDSGLTLTSSPRFAALMPPDGHANFSGLTYHNLQSVLGPLAKVWNQARGGLSPEQQESMRELVESTPANLACVYGEEDRIVFVNNSEDDFFAGLLGFGSALGAGAEGMMEELFQGRGLEELVERVSSGKAAI